MSRKVVLFLSAAIMAVLALVVVLVFREPVPQVSEDMEGDSVSGPLQTSPVQPLAAPLPPAEAMVMSSGDDLPVTQVQPSQENLPEGMASLVHDAPSGSASITEPPAVPLVPAASEASSPSSEATPAPTASNTQAQTGAAASSAASAAASSSPSSSSAAPADSAVAPSPIAPAASGESSGQAADPSGQSAAAASPQAAPATSSPASPATPAPEEKEALAKVLVTKSSLAPAEGKQVITSAVLTMDGELVTLRLQGNAPLTGKAFTLTGPERVVLDLDGRWTVEAPRVPSNRMVRALRVGNQENTTRLVFDMRVKVNKSAVSNPDATSLELSIR